MSFHGLLGRSPVPDSSPEARALTLLLPTRALCFSACHVHTHSLASSFRPACGVRVWIGFAPTAQELGRGVCKRTVLSSAADIWVLVPFSLIPSCRLSKYGPDRVWPKAGHVQPGATLSVHQPGRWQAGLPSQVCGLWALCKQLLVDNPISTLPSLLTEPCLYPGKLCIAKRPHIPASLAARVIKEM